MKITYAIHCTNVIQMLTGALESLSTDSAITTEIQEIQEYIHKNL